MVKEGFAVLNPEPREHAWKNSYRYNLSGQEDAWNELTANPHYRKNHLGYIHPLILNFYRNKTKSWKSTKKAEEFWGAPHFQGNLEVERPKIIDLAYEGSCGILKPEFISPTSNYDFDSNKTLVLICDLNKRLESTQESKGQTFSFSYKLIPLLPYEILEIGDISFNELLEKSPVLNSGTIRETAQQFAHLKSLENLLASGAILLEDIPIELMPRAGQIDREHIGKKERM
jgi:hypothetical protein